MQNTQVNSRLIFENALAVADNAKLSVDVTKCTISTLRLEQQALTTKTQYQFPVLNNQMGTTNTIFNTEIRLTQQDSFVAAAWGFYISKPSSTTDATYILHTYPSPAVFTTSGVAAASETLYNSIIQIQINNDVILPVLSTVRFRYVPQSQQVAAGTNQNGIAQDQIDLSQDGCIPVEPNILFIGSKNTVINLNLPAALAVVETNQRMHMIFHGVLMQNSTIIT